MDIEDLLKTDIMPLISDLKKSIREEIESMQERCEECENGEIHDTNPKNIIIDEILSLKSLE